MFSHHSKTAEIGRGRRLSASVILATVAFVGVGGIAHAEGSFTSSLSTVGPGHGSRTWTDKNTDASATSIRSWSCWNDSVFQATAKPTYELLKRNVGPVTSYGKRTAADCKGDKAATVSWTRPPAGDYNFAYRAVNGLAHTFSAAEVKVSW